MRPFLSLLSPAFLFATALTASAASGEPRGQPGAEGRPTPEAAFTALDTDKSGGVTLEEFRAMKPPGDRPAPPAGAVAGMFKSIDKDKSGELNLAEFKAMPAPPR